MQAALSLDLIREKLRIIKPKTPDAGVPATRAYQAGRVTAMDDGLNMNRPDGGIIKYADISMILTFRLDIDPDTWYIELFIYGQPMPFRLPLKAINFRQFLPEVSQRSKENFTAFLLYVVTQCDSVYVDEHTLEFLKSGKILGFPDFKFFEDYSRQLWFQLVSWMKFECENCGEVYWVDDAKISAQGAKTKCTKCQNIIQVSKRDKPEPFISKDKRKTVACPHCGYENQEGAQFCVMCQEALGEIKPKTKPKPQPKAETEPEAAAPPTAQAPHAKPEEPPAPPIDLANLPLQAREKRAPQLTLQELADSLQDDEKTLENKFSWYSAFATAMQVFGSLLMMVGIIAAIAIFTVRPEIPTAETWTDAERLRYAIAALVSGVLSSLVFIISSNVIALNLEIERNTRTTALLLQRLLSRLK